jgi:tetratricopeptide (TPR) repeat protein
MVVNKSLWLSALTLTLASLTCGPDTEGIAQADRPHDKHAAAAHTPSPMAKAWQASLGFEAAGKFEEALSALSGVPAPQSSSYLVNYRRGWLAYRLGHYADAVNAYSVAASLEPNSVEVRVALLSPLIAQSKWNEVAQAAQDVLKLDPENYLALQRLAYAKFNTQHYPEAETLYRHLVQLYPSDLDMRAGLAWAALRMGKQKEAVALFNEVLDVSADHASAASGLYEANKPGKRHSKD